LLARARLYALNNDPQPALADLDKLLTIDANNVGARVLRARLYSGQQLNAQALDELNTAATMQPNDPAAFKARAALLRQLGDSAGAEADLERARALEPGNLDLALQQVALLKQQNRLSDALAIYRAILPSAADPAPLYLDAGEMRYSMRNYRRALANYTIAAELRPDDGAAFYGIGLAQRKLGDFGAAKQAFKTYIRLNPAAAERAELEAWIAKWGG
jgi:tetratricopeptide (TPR) repeat protein